MSDKLGYTFYPKDFISDPDVMMMTSSERGIYRDLIDLAYMSGNRIKYNITQLAKYCNDSEANVQKILELKAKKAGDVWEIPSCNKRIEKANISRKNGSKGGIKPKMNPEGNPERTQKRSQREREIESEDEIINEWIRWGNQIVEENDPIWQGMRGRKIGQAEMTNFLSVATRNKWQITTQQEFRVSVNGFDSNKFSNGRGSKNEGKIQ